MSTGKRRMLGIGVLAALVVIPASAGLRDRPQSRDDATIKVASHLALGGARLVSSALDRGATFNELERQALRVSTTFEDAEVVSERTAGGVRARVRDRFGNPLASLSVDKRVGFLGTIRFDAAGAAPVVVAQRADLEPALDWAARQAYAFLKDGDAAGGRFEWQHNLARRVGRAPRDIDAAMVSVRTEFGGGLTATARWRTPGKAFRAAPRATDSFTTFLERDGQPLGWVRWYADRRELAWSFANGDQGVVDASRLEEIGGWPFTPDLAWSNVQAFALHHMPAQTPPPGTLIRPEPGPVARLLQALAPTVHAQDGCTGLHWLDGSIFRVCCDRHDLCYYAFGCDRYSWFWPFSGSWRCATCNSSAVYCFQSLGQPFHQTP